MAKTIKKMVDGVVHEMPVDEAKEFEEARASLPEKKAPAMLSRELVTDDAAKAIARAVKADKNLEALAEILLGTEKLIEMMEAK